MKISELKNIVTKVVKEMSMVSGGDAGGANVTGGPEGEQTFTPVTVKKSKKVKKVKQEVKDVEPKLAAGKVKNNYYVTHFGYTPAPSIPNRKSKAMDYKKIFEDDLPSQEVGTDEVVATLNNPNLEPDVKKMLMAAYRNKQITGEGLVLIVNLILSKGAINENYSQFRNKTSKREAPEQLHKAVKEIKKKLEEVDKLVEYTHRLRSEVSEGEGEPKYNRHTTRVLEQIQEMIKHTYIKAKKLK